VIAPGLKVGLSRTWLETQQSTLCGLPGYDTICNFL